MRPGQPQAEALPPSHQIRQTAPAGEKVVEELQPLGLLAAGDGQVRPLEAFGRRGDGVVRGPQDGESRGAQGDRSPGVRQFPPQSPGRRQEEVDQAAQRDTALRGALAGPAIASKFRRRQAAAGAGRIQHGRQVAGQQFGGHSTGLAARRLRDRPQIGLSGGAVWGHDECPFLCDELIIA